MSRRRLAAADGSIFDRMDLRLTGTALRVFLTNPIMLHVRNCEACLESRPCAALASLAANPEGAR